MPVTQDGLDMRYPKCTPQIQFPTSQMGRNFGSAQFQPRCAQFELWYRRCAATYGYPRNQEMCRYEYRDFMECIFEYKQKARQMYIEDVQRAKYRAGKTSQKYLGPPTQMVYEYLDSPVH